MAILIKNGNVVLEDGQIQTDIVIEEEKIDAIGEFADYRNFDQVYDASNLLVLPGVIDAHTHFYLESGSYTTADDFNTGTRSAACGGVTTVIDFATQVPGETLSETIEKRHEQAAGKVNIDYGLHAIVADISQGQDQEIQKLVEMGIVSMKLFTTYRKTMLYADDEMISKILNLSNSLGFLVQVHAEDDLIVENAKTTLINQGLTLPKYHGKSRPAQAESEAVKRMISLAGKAKSPLYIVHNSTPDSLELISHARQRGEDVIAESCPQYLLLNDTAFEGEHPEEFTCSPPIRPIELVKRMNDLVLEGKVDVIGTDHCGFKREQKRMATSFLDAANGLPGVETLLAAMYSHNVASGHLSITRLMKMLSTNPAKIFGLYPQKGTIKVGSDADLVLFDPKVTYTLQDHMLHSVEGAYTPYAGREITGKVEKTFSRGKLIYDEGQFLGALTHGRFLPGKPFDRSIIATL